MNVTKRRPTMSLMISQKCLMNCTIGIYVSLESINNVVTCYCLQRQFVVVVVV